MDTAYSHTQSPLPDPVPALGGACISGYLYFFHTSNLAILILLHAFHFLTHLPSFVCIRIGINIATPSLCPNILHMYYLCITLFSLQDSFPCFHFSSSSSSSPYLIIGICIPHP
ncbi:hypothetical protein B0I35DRAFT_117361 [Stachybotrys elegans]|uniref:Uncharacterized protein n=1 Tax=Stachybotrys elegans TaxID=80388 RepID=A0A8K0T440_9HYPO|nr:hypothetical protein B0I35DRAFT_117361 [Stachybotrys elegans]